jgi:hypothetical protein
MLQATQLAGSGKVKGEHVKLWKISLVVEVVKLERLKRSRINSRI